MGINTEMCSSRLEAGRKADAFLRKKMLLQNPKEWKPDGLMKISYQAEYSKEGCGSERPVLLMMMMVNT